MDSIKLRGHGKIGSWPCATCSHEESYHIRMDWKRLRKQHGSCWYAGCRTIKCQRYTPVERSN